MCACREEACLTESENSSKLCLFADSDPFDVPHRCTTAGNPLFGSTNLTVKKTLLVGLNLSVYSAHSSKAVKECSTVILHVG